MVLDANSPYSYAYPVKRTIYEPLATPPVNIILHEHHIVPRNIIP